MSRQLRINYVFNFKMVLIGGGGKRVHLFFFFNFYYHCTNQEVALLIRLVLGWPPFERRGITPNGEAPFVAV